MQKDSQRGRAIMTESFERLVHKINPTSNLLRAWRLTGGISAEVTALEVENSDGTRKKMIVRQHGEGDRASNPNIAEDEFKLLEKLKAKGLPVAAPYLVDHELFPHPVIVIEYIEGTTDFNETKLPQFAATIAAVHSVPKDDFAFLPQKADIYAAEALTRPAELDISLQEDRIRDTLELIGQVPQVNKSVLLHGDYWQGNVLWQDGKLSGVIDWEDAAIGDPIADLASTRLEMLWAFGLEGMEEFTQLYHRHMPHVDLTYLPYWDLYTATQPAFRLHIWAEGDHAREQKMREGHYQFVTQAFAKLLPEI
jgi:aminoglycoside phosphotransferase (APT) family kinase protein